MDLSSNQAWSPLVEPEPEPFPFAHFSAALADSTTHTTLPLSDASRAALVKFTTRLLHALVNDGVAQFDFSLQADQVTILERHHPVRHIPLSLTSILSFTESVLADAQSSAKNVSRVLEELRQCCANEMLCAGYKERVWIPRISEQLRAEGFTCMLDLLFAMPWHVQLLLTEQFASLNSHPFHAMAKTKLPLTPAEVLKYCPEYAQDVPVVVAAVRAAFVVMSTSSVGNTSEKRFDLGEHFGELFPAVFEKWREALIEMELEPREFVPIPIHPANVGKVERLFGMAIGSKDVVLATGVSLKTRPLMSFRTTVPDVGYRKVGEKAFPLHVKLPVAVQITSELRYLSPVEANDGPVLTELLLKLLKRHNNFEHRLFVLEETVGAHYSYDADPRYTYENARYLSCIYRKSPCTVLLEENVNKETVLLPLAALLTSTDKNYLDEDHLLLFEVIRRYHKSRSTREPLKTSVLCWFEDYAKAILQSMFRLFLIYGIALEAHQQNLLLVVGPSGKVVKLLVRDLQVVCRERILALHELVPKLHKREDSMLNEREMYHAYNYFFHTTFVSNLIYISGILASHYSTEQETYLSTIRALVTSQLKTSEEEARNILPHPKFEIWLDHLNDVKTAVLGKTYQHKCLLKMRCAGNKYETYTKRANVLHK